MADTINANPFKIVAVDTTAHELEIQPSILGNAPGPIQIYLECTTGTIQVSADVAISSQSGTISSASNSKTIISSSKMKFSYKATTVGDTFQGAF